MGKYDNMGEMGLSPPNHEQRHAESNAKTSCLEFRFRERLIKPK